MLMFEESNMEPMDKRDFPLRYKRRPPPSSSDSLDDSLDYPESLFSKINTLFQKMLIIFTLMAIVYIMLEYRCLNCKAKDNITEITRNLENIASNLAQMKDNYHVLESRITQFSNDLPKIEGQIEVLEAIASSKDKNLHAWEARPFLCLPNVDVVVGNEYLYNSSQAF